MEAVGGASVPVALAMPAESAGLVELAEAVMSVLELGSALALGSPGSAVAAEELASLLVGMAVLGTGTPLDAAAPLGGVAPAEVLAAALTVPATLELADDAPGLVVALPGAS